MSKGNNAAFYDKNVPEEQQGLCMYIYKYSISLGSLKEYNNTLARVNFYILAPIITFFCFDKPQDWFSEFGKDPERNFSIFQFSLEEKARRHFVAKHGKKDSLNNTYLNEVLINCTLNQSNLARRQSQLNMNVERNYLTSKEERESFLLDEELVYRFGGSLYEKEEENRSYILEMAHEDDNDDEED